MRLGLLLNHSLAFAAPSGGAVVAPFETLTEEDNSTGSSITLGWTPSEFTPTGTARIERYDPSGAFEDTWHTIFEGPVADGNYVDETGLNFGETYSYRIYHVVDAVDSAPVVLSDVVVFYPVPVNTVAPEVSSDSGTLVGAILTTDNGTWDGSPTSYTYDWVINVSSTGVTTASINTGSFGEGDYYCLVTAINPGGASTPAASDTHTIIAE